MDDEQLQYPVHGSQVRYAVASMRAQGIPFGVQPGAGGVYIIIVPAGYAPMVQNAPWVHQPAGPVSVLRDFPIVQIAVAILILVVAWFGFQAAPVLLASLGSGDAAVVEKGSEEEGESGNPLQAALDSVLAIPDRVTGEIDRRVDEAKQEVQEAMFSAAMMACGVPLLVVFGGLAALLVLRMAMRGRQ